MLCHLLFYYYLKEDTVEDCEDGYWEGEFIYECAAYRGTFVELTEIEPANSSKRKMPQGR